MLRVVQRLCVSSTDMGCNVQPKVVQMASEDCGRSAGSWRRVSGSESMKMMSRLMCCAMVAGAAMIIPHKANAQSDDDKKFLAMAAQSDQNEIALSQVAEQKASNPAVKAFAEKMVTEHKQMTASMKPFADEWGLTPPTGPDADHQKELDKLNGLSGADFDKEYMSQMVSDHSKALSAFTSEAKDTKDAKFRAAVIKGKTAVAAHKNMAYDLKKKL
jgi:putative membrane protein